MQVACAVDDAYAPYCAVMLHSLLQAMPNRAVVIHHAAPSDVGAAAIERFDAVARHHGCTVIRHFVPANALEGLAPMGLHVRLQWYRLLLPALLPNLDRVLYLDADTLVVDGLEKLWSLDLQGSVLGAVRNHDIGALGMHAAELGMPRGAPYFNSGVLLMDLEAMRRSRAAERALAFARQNATRMRYWDQDAINAALWRECRELDPRWNTQAALFRRFRSGLSPAEQAAVQNPAVLHFEGVAIRKPWHYLCGHPWARRYRTVLARTPGQAIPLIGRSPATVALRMLPGRWREAAYERWWWFRHQADA